MNRPDEHQLPPEKRCPRARTRETTRAVAATVFFDGACPLCRQEIAHYRRIDRSATLQFVDVSASDVELPIGLDRRQALARFHVRSSEGQLVSGAAAFVEIWAALPGWRWVARLARLPGALTMLELGYRLFLPLRPHLARLLPRSRPASSHDNT